MKALVFDMDGVLVDPTESYRGALLDTVEHFSGRRVGHERVVELKNQGGYNDNCVLGVRILQEYGVEVAFEDFAAHFRRLFWGDNQDGLILKERWLVEDGLFGRLAMRFRLGIYTGRTIRSASFTLQRFAPGVVFDPIVTRDQVETPKPAPDGLIRFREAVPEAEPVYVGDNIDDARCARAAGVPFIGIVARQAPRRGETVEMFRREGAREVIESVNVLESVL